jgi:hypothetical protein
METIKEQQDADNKLQCQATKYADRYIRKCVSTVDEVLYYVKPGDPLANWKIALPKLMLQPTICWFHQITGHPDSKRLHMQISSHYYHQDLQCMTDNYHCDHCQRNKLDGNGYGTLPERKIQAMPFEECAVDLVGPWIIQVFDKHFKFNALTIIDTVSNLVELVRIDDKTWRTLPENMHKSGSHAIHGQHNAYEANSLDQSSNSCCKVVEPKMFQPPVKICKPMQYVSACTKQ